MITLENLIGLREMPFSSFLFASGGSYALHEFNIKYFLFVIVFVLYSLILNEKWCIEKWLRALTYVKQVKILLVMLFSWIPI